MAFDSIEELLQETQQKPLWKVILEDDLHTQGISYEESWNKMQYLWDAMKSASQNYQGELTSVSGLIGGDGAKMQHLADTQQTIGGDFLADIITQALKMGESNACMKRIVAAPTAGSCGVLPAVLIPFCKKFQTSDDEIIKALYVSAGFGQIIALRASISGAEGGCQAEIGSASAMAAAALVSLKGGSPTMAAHACAMALKSLMGLVCDPVAGLVEIPCVKRNVVGAVNAVSCADMALAGITSAIPPDEVIDAMQSVGLSMPITLKETGKGGLAATPTGQRIAKKMKK